MRVRGACAAILFVVSTVGAAQSSPPADSTPLQFIVTSDVHFGITRKAFRGDSNVSAARVNAAMIRQMNTMPALVLPLDGGVGAGRRVGSITMLAITGDLANRAEEGLPTAAESWAEFRGAFIDSLRLCDAAGRPSRLMLVPGNHDISNAIGYPRPLYPGPDASSAAGIFNLMMQPAVPLTPQNYDYARDRVHVSTDFGGVHCAFLNIWPDSAERAWLARDLARVSNATPVLLLAHDPPVGDPKHFRNPFGAHDINAVDRFENLLSETYQDGVPLPPAGAAKEPDNPRPPTEAEQRALGVFLQGHPNIRAYFHGHNNFNEFYDWVAPDASVRLPAFRVDSPMKGAQSATDETRVSFQLVTLDAQHVRLTVREILWNSAPLDPTAPIRFGAVRTIDRR
jgi:hypothetical protein